MSEKRFVCIDIGYGDEWYITDNGERLSEMEIVDLLNDQQATINKQDEEIKKLKRTERSWRKIHCCNKESDNCGIVIEQQATINKLKEENEQLRKELDSFKPVMFQDMRKGTIRLYAKGGIDE